MKVHAGFFINIPAKGNQGAKEALRRQPYWLSKLVPEGQAETIAAMMTDKQCYFGPSPTIVCTDKTEVVVHIFGVPATSSALLDPTHRLYHQMNRRLLDSPKKLLDICGEPIEVLGLGAATAIASGHGRRVLRACQVLNRPIPVVTSGNTITAGLSVEIAVQAVKDHEHKSPHSVGVLGGFGSVGSRVVAMAAEVFKPRLMVITTSRTDHNHAEDLKNLEQQFPATTFRVGDLKQAVSCSLAFLATSSVSALPIDPSWPPENGILIDIGKPLNTNPLLLAERPDLTILDGSLAKLPSGTDWREHCYRMALPENGVFGCLAETITLARLFALGKLDSHRNGKTFVGKPNLTMVHAMLEEAHQTGLSPMVVPAHRP